MMPTIKCPNIMLNPIIKQSEEVGREEKYILWNLTFDGISKIFILTFVKGLKKKTWLLSCESLSSSSWLKE